MSYSSNTNSPYPQTMSAIKNHPSLPKELQREAGMLEFHTCGLEKQREGLIRRVRNYLQTMPKYADVEAPGIECTAVVCRKDYRDLGHV
jgi:hypothetical protein